VAEKFVRRRIRSKRAREWPSAVLAGRTCLASFWSTYWPRFQTAINCPASGFAQEKRRKQVEKEKMDWPQLELIANA
jgi:hypothetical protein